MLMSIPSLSTLFCGSLAAPDLAPKLPAARRTALRGTATYFLMQYPAAPTRFRSRQTDRGRRGRSNERLSPDRSRVCCIARSRLASSEDRLSSWLWTGRSFECALNVRAAFRLAMVVGDDERSACT